MTQLNKPSDSEWASPDALRQIADSNTLVFPAALERRFRRHYDAQAVASTRSTALVTLGVILVFAILDRFALPQHYTQAWMLRATVQVPTALALLALTYWNGFARHLQLWLGGGLLLGSVASLAIIGQASADEWAYYLYPYLLALTICIAYTGSRLRFTWSIAVGVLITVGFGVVGIGVMDYWAQPDGGVLLALATMFLIAINAVTADSCFNTERLMRRSFVQQRLIELENERAERLLHNILPASIAERLKRGELVADTVANAGVMFADITQFTQMASRSEAAQVVMLLDILFSRFDALAEKHGVEKIKTVGDAYMVASGVPEPQVDYAARLARMALEMIEAVEQVRGEYPDVNVRIGMAFGAVVAGVIGRKRLIYDLWGDTVNTASRMESHGLAGKIQMDAEAQRLLRQQFRLEPRGSIYVKGKGPMTTYLLTGELTSSLGNVA